MPWTLFIMFYDQSTVYKNTVDLQCTEFHHVNHTTNLCPMWYMCVSSPQIIFCIFHKQLHTNNPFFFNGMTFTSDSAFHFAQIFIFFLLSGSSSIRTFQDPIVEKVKSETDWCLTLFHTFEYWTEKFFLFILFLLILKCQRSKLLK